MVYGSRIDKVRTTYVGSNVRGIVDNLGAPPSCENGNLPNDIARSQGHTDVVALLERHGG